MGRYVKAARYFNGEKAIKMSWANNLTIRTKVIGAFALVLVITAVLGVFAVTRLSKVNDGAEELASNWLVATRSLGDFATATSRFRQVEASVALATTDEARQQEDQRLNGELLPAVKAALAVYEPTIGEGEERNLYTGVSAKWNAYLGMTERYMALARTDRAKAGNMYLGEMKTSFNDFHDSLKALLKFQLDGAAAERKTIGDTYESAWYWIIAMIALAGSLCLAAGLFIVSNVSKPIRAMTDAMSRLAKHDLATVIDGIGRKDEVGQMASAVQVFKDSMIEGDRLKLDQLTQAFETSVGSVVQTVASQATQMEGSAQSMSATAEETTKQAAAVAAASEQSSANVQTVASATEELSSSISEIGRQVSHSSQIAASAVTEANRANDMVQGLVSASSKIGEVVALINEIADQTNLLALNATIEAARAGEAGKGFAVVAAEVKNLATQTSKATEDISAQISSVQAATQDAVKAIGTIGKTIGEIDQIATAIAAAVEEQGAATQEIARNVEEAAKGTQEVSSNIGGVTQAANDTGSVAGQVLGAARALTGQSGHLKDLVQTFLADVKAA